GVDCRCRAGGLGRHVRAGDGPITRDLMTAISVMLIVPDADAAIAWYKEALGAQELWNLGGVAGLHVAGAPFFLHEVNPGNPAQTSPDRRPLAAAIGLTSRHYGEWTTATSPTVSTRSRLCSSWPRPIRTRPGHIVARPRRSAPPRFPSPTWSKPDGFASCGGSDRESRPGYA